MSSLVFLGEKDNQFANKIDTVLKDAGYLISAFDNFRQLQDKANQEYPSILVLNAHILEKTGDLETLFRSFPTIIYAPAMNVDSKLLFYHKGVKRVITGNEETFLQLINAVKMITYRNNELRRARQQSLTHGTLQTFSLQDVLQNAMLEKKNLILKIKRDRWNSKIRTFQGHVVNAFTSNLINEDAILKTMHVPVGSFVIRSYKKDEEFSPMSSSTLAIVAEAKFEQNAIRRFLNRWELENPEFEIISGIEQNEFSADMMTAIELVKKFKNFQNILLNSSFSVLKTLRLIEQLIKTGVVIQAGEGEAVHLLQMEDIEFIRENLLQPNSTHGNLIVLGLPSSGRTELIRTIAGFQRAPIKSVQSLDFTRINLQSHLSLTIFGVSIEEAFLPILEKLSKGIVACIFLVDYARSDKFEFSNYILNQLLQIYSVPFVIGLTNTGGNNDKAIKNFKNLFPLPSGAKVVPVDTGSFADIRQLFYNCTSVATQTNEEENV